MYRKKLVLILTAILATSITIPMIRAPARQPERFGDPVGNLIADKDDPTLIGPAASLIAAIDNVENLERQLNFDPDSKSLSDLSPRDQARLLRAVNHANAMAHKFKLEAGLYEKSVNPIEINALNYIDETIPDL